MTKLRWSKPFALLLLAFCAQGCFFTTGVRNVADGGWSGNQVSPWGIGATVPIPLHISVMHADVEQESDDQVARLIQNPGGPPLFTSLSA